MRLRKFYRFFSIWRVPVYFHWYAVLMFVVLVAGSPFFGLPLLFIVLGLFSVLLVHELGHALLVRQFGYEVERISIYPIHGLCHYDEPYSEYEDSVIAWGGVLAQLLLFIP